LHPDNSEIFELSGLQHPPNRRDFSWLDFGDCFAFLLTGKPKHMTLRIQRSDEHNRVVLRLIGRIQADQVPELETLLSSGPDHNVILDLKEVKLVDREAVRFLAKSEAEGTKLRNCSAFIREWISQERNEMRREKTEHQQL
jgi:hypothetical protein